MDELPFGASSQRSAKPNDIIMKRTTCCAKSTGPMFLHASFSIAAAAKLFLLLLLMLSAVARAQYDITVNFDGGVGSVLITKYTGFDSVVTIPTTIAGYPVTSIGYRAFFGTGVTAVTIPNTVTSIEREAFWDCTIMEGITIPNSVINIGDSAFYGCRSLSSVVLGDRVASIGNEAFDDCSSMVAITVSALNSVYSSVDGVLYNKTRTTLIKCPEGKVGALVIPSSITFLGSFAYCHRLTSITIPDSVTSIADYAFAACGDLTAITVSAFNSAYSSADGVLFNKAQTTLIKYPEGKAGAYTIPNSTTSIERIAFRDSGSLKAVTIGNGVTSIKDSTFSGCVSLASVNFGNNVTSIGDFAFDYCRSLTNVFIPDSVIAIGTRAFGYCTNLATLMIGNRVTSIKEGAFSDCNSLTSVMIPDSVTTIESGAFAECGSLANVTIGKSVISLGSSVFNYCTNLAGVYFRGNAPSVGMWALNGDDAATVYYLSGTTGWEPTFAGRPTAVWTLPPCTQVILSPAMRSMSSSGGSGAFSLSVSGDCGWYAVSSETWLRATGGGSGNGRVTYVADPNTASTFRTGTITAGGQTFTLTQGSAGFGWHSVFGWIFEAGSHWYHADGFGWMWFHTGGQWIWSNNLQGWLAVTDSDSRTLWSAQFRWLTPSATDPYKADTTSIGPIYIGKYTGAAITDGWVVSDRFGHVWANGDGNWFYSTTYGWLGVTPDGGIWCVSLGRFL